MDSSFDELLAELDKTPPAQEDPAKTEAMRKLMDASKHLEKIATILDPSDVKHMLHGLSLPPEARARLQEVVKHLMTIQHTLETLEQNLLGEKAIAPETVPEAVITEPVALQEVPTSEEAAPPEPPHVEPVQDPERIAFEAYKTQWEAVFAADPLLKEQHPEVLAYYTQMETYFREKELHAAKKATP